MDGGAYSSVKGWLADVGLIVANCRAYNPPTSIHCIAARKLEEHVERLQAKGDATYAAAVNASV